MAGERYFAKPALPLQPDIDWPAGTPAWQDIDKLEFKVSRFNKSPVDTGKTVPKMWWNQRRGGEIISQRVLCFPPTGCKHMKGQTEIVADGQAAYDAGTEGVILGLSALATAYTGNTEYSTWQECTCEDGLGTVMRQGPLTDTECAALVTNTTCEAEQFCAWSGSACQAGLFEQPVCQIDCSEDDIDTALPETISMRVGAGSVRDMVVLEDIEVNRDASCQSCKAGIGDAHCDSGSCSAESDAMPGDCAGIEGYAPGGLAAAPTGTCVRQAEESRSVAVVKEENLSIGSFSVQAACRAGYTGVAHAVPCTASGEAYTLAGCWP